MNVLFAHICLLSALFYAGCTRSPDSQMSRIKTTSTLARLRVILTQYSKDAISRLRSVREFLTDAESKHLIKEEHHELLEMDGWNNLFVWKLTDDYLTIISAGPNGKVEDGKRDDLFIRMNLAKRTFQGNID